jgi:ATP-binding cassette, subfamily B, bacterial
MNYTLTKSTASGQKVSIGQSLKKMLPYLADQKRRLIISAAAVLVSTASTLLAPIIVSRTIDTYIQNKDMGGVLVFAALLMGIFLIGLAGSYILTINMGTVGREVLWKMRNALFNKLQELPVAFFNQNQAGDLISRINNDTDKLNQLFAQVLMQFIGNAFVIAGAGVMLVVLNVRLGLAALVPAAGIVIITQLLSGWVKRKNTKSLQTLGGMSAEIQESLANFRVILAFNRLDYFRKKFDEANTRNYDASVSAGVASSIFAPVYGLASALAQVITLVVGILLITSGNLTVGLLIGFLLYVNGFYTPLRQIATVWSSLQLALASLDRIYEVLALKSNMALIPAKTIGDPAKVLEFRNVSFSYPDGQEVLRNINFALERGKTYALVGPTGGGKTTPASLMARLYDPASGLVLIDGQDIRSVEPQARANKIGFILQDPFLFNGTIRDNIVYGHDEYGSLPSAKLAEILKRADLESLIARFNDGLETKVAANGDGLSLGQKQIIAFMRAVLRRPEILILDEATANIDTVTEQVLDEIIAKLPAATTKVIIAHRLNTISNADVIYFVNAGEVTMAGSMEQAVAMLMHGKRGS